MPRPQIVSDVQVPAPAGLQVLLVQRDAEGLDVDPVAVLVPDGLEARRGGRGDLQRVDQDVLIPGHADGDVDQTLPDEGSLDVGVKTSAHASLS